MLPIDNNLNQNQVSVVEDEEIQTHNIMDEHVLNVKEEDIMEFERICMNIGAPCTTIGRETNSGRLTFNDVINISIVKLKNIYE